MADKNTEIHQNNPGFQIDASAQLRKKSIRVGARLFQFDQPRIMGILNITPDSFYAGSRINSLEAATRQAARMLEEGADILDIGAYSSRPGAADISQREEAERLIPVLKGLIKEFPEAIFSVDTFRASVAQAAIAEGAHIINDISAGDLDPKMIDIVASEKVPYIIMHMKGTPQTMQSEASYEDVVLDVFKYMQRKIAVLKEAGVADIIADPGFGFAKTIDQNYQLLSKLEIFKQLSVPLLAGLSRKSMIWKTLDIDASEALNGTTILNSVSLMKGADILRVHDVKPAAEAIKLIAMLN